MPIEKKVWSTALKKTIDFSFLRWNLSDDYNYEMNDNDVADQLRLVYWIMRFQRNIKWWWALFLWSYEVSLVNSYVMYKRYCELKGVPVQWTHHDWNEAI
jgi:adenosine deaminase